MVDTELKAGLSERDPFVSSFESVERREGGVEPSWLLPIRKAGLARFAELGFPTTKDENWRFTNVSAVQDLPFHPAPPSRLDEPNRRLFEERKFQNVGSIRLVFVDGYFNAELSDLSRLPETVAAASLMEQLNGGGAVAKECLSLSDISEENAFAHLNAAYFSDGALIVIPHGFDLETPIQIVHFSTGAERGRAVQTRHLIVAEPGSRATVLESFHGAGEMETLTNAAVKLLVRDDACLEYCKFQDESPSAYHVANLYTEMGRRSKLHLHSIALGAKLSRNDIRAKLNGEGLECVLNGLYLTHDDQLADHHMIVEHAQPHCDSHEYFNGILNGKSRGVFHGRILVQQIAQKTDAKQTNKNLLLSDQATVNTKPQLEIYADDVKCTHGATIGQMNDEAIFYLRSRGLGFNQARRMLMHSFAGEIVDRIQCAVVKERIDRIIWDRLDTLMSESDED